MKCLVTYKDTNIPVKAGDVVKIDQNGDLTNFTTVSAQTAAGNTNIINRITADPAKVGQQLLGGSTDFSAFMPPSMGGGIDTNTTNQQMAQTIKNMYHDLNKVARHCLLTHVQVLLVEAQTR